MKGGGNDSGKTGPVIVYNGPNNVIERSKKQD